jgi:ubiquinone/menaquinone biosynthesis C-methylase UbiE
MTSKEKEHRICPVELAGGLDNSLRKLFQNPHRILKSYIAKGMTVLDLGCGPGYFTMEIVKMLNNSGKTIAADLQDGMLKKLTEKIKGTELEKRIVLHKCEESRIGISEKVDFVLAFYMIHEVKNKDNLFLELKSILNPDGKILIVEPMFHVSKKAFEEMIVRLEATGFKIIERPKVFYGRTVLITV